MEQSFIAYLRGRCRHLPQVPLGIGDDAAVLDTSKQPVVCVDQIIDGVDFRSGEHSLVDVGYKAVAINLSDLAAMGAWPTSILVAGALPRDNATRMAGEVFEGIFEAAEEFGFAIAGGDTSTYEGPLSLTVTAVGEIPDGCEVWKRGGAQVNDILVVTGPVGGSILGRHLRPNPRLKLARELQKSIRVSAAIDVSDGLSLDMDRLLARSGVGVELDVDAIPIHQDAIRLAEQTGRSAFDHAWSDGEDFELILTMAPEEFEKLSSIELESPLFPIGKVTSRTGLWKLQDGRHERLPPKGFEHVE